MHWKVVDICTPLKYNYHYLYQNVYARVGKFRMRTHPVQTRENHVKLTLVSLNEFEFVARAISYCARPKQFIYSIGIRKGNQTEPNKLIAVDYNNFEIEMGFH